VTEVAETYIFPVFLLKVFFNYI